MSRVTQLAAPRLNDVTYGRFIRAALGETRWKEWPVTYIRLPSDYTVDQFILDVKRLTPGSDVTESILSDVAERMSRLSHRQDLIQIGEALYGVNARQAVRLHVEPDNSLHLGLGEFPKGHSGNEVHNHGTWGVFCAYIGREAYTTWRRVDDGSTPGQAKLELLEHQILNPGDATFMTDPPGDIHGHEPIGDSFWIMALFGKSVLNIDRHYFTPHWTVRDVVLSKPSE